jgi:hypothetical protein
MKFLGGKENKIGNSTNRAERSQLQEQLQYISDLHRDKFDEPHSPRERTQKSFFP